MNSESIDKIVEEVTKQVYEQLNKSELVKVESSARHIHLSQDILELLFGSNSVLEEHRDISQPGQFLSKQTGCFSPWPRSFQIQNKTMSGYLLSIVGL